LNYGERDRILAGLCALAGWRPYMASLLNQRSKRVRDRRCSQSCQVSVSVPMNRTA